MYRIGLAVLLSAVAFCVNGFAEESESGAAAGDALWIRLDLKDGSSLLGTPVAEALQVTTRYGWDLDVPMLWVSSFSFKPDATNAVLHLQEGDQLTVQMRDPSIKLESLIGRLEIKMESIVSMNVVPAQADLPLALRDGLLAFYPFAAAEGGRCSDRSGMKRHGKVVNAEWTANGKIGGAMRFLPTNSYVVASDAGLPMGKAPRSIAFWMKLDNTNPTASGHGCVLVYGAARHNQTCFMGMDWRVGRNSIGFFQHGGVNVAAQKLDANRWYHVVYTYGGRNEHAIYINGSRDDFAALEISMDLDTAPTGNLYLGVNGGDTFDGWLDEVMIFNRALEPADVRQLFERR